MLELLNRLLVDEGLFIPFLLAAGILTGMLIKSATRVCTTVSRERTKREIAAYVAEGSMTPEQGERILRAGNDRTA